MFRIAFLSSALILAACSEAQQSTSPQANGSDPMTSNDAKTVQSLTGTIVYKNMEGGFYAFDAEDGKHYTLQGLSNEYRKNGLKVKVTGSPMPEVMTFTQYGTVFQVDSIEVLDDSQVKPADDTY